MRATALFLLLVSTLSASVVDAIAHVESGVNHRAVGDNGLARGAWQMHRQAWADATRRLGMAWEFERAHSAREAREVATEHLRWLCAQFTNRTGRRATPADQYALWNLGVAGYARRNWQLSACPSITRRAVSKLETILTR